MPSPVRRSARGQPVASSSTSSLSSRQDRSTRGGLNNAKAGTPKSLSSEDASEPPVARRSQRQPAHKEDSTGRDAAPADDNDDDAAEEEEITRCICGQQDYPGPPLSEAFVGVVDTQSDEPGGLFILCDGCSVWQHGGCVGIVEESQCPDKYYCEECRPKQHAVSVDSRGQKYSLYLPLHPKANRKGSVSKHDDKAKKERESVASRASVDPSTGKRRATMRSKEHDDEEEQLKRAIEESKRELEPAGGNGRRNGKRSRDDSEDTRQESKRQRRASESIPSVTRTGSLDDNSDDASMGTSSRAKKAKAEAAQTMRQAEQKAKDKEREKAKQEAAGRRQERARSRRNEEADGGDEITMKHTASNETSPPPESSQPPTPPPAEKPVVRRGPGKKPGKKLGNNQYTKRHLEQSASSPHGRKRQLQGHASGSGDDASEVAVNGETNGSNSGAGSKTSPSAPGGPENGTGKGKFGRGKKALANGTVKAPAPGEEVERTFTNMQAALKNMSTWVARQQDDLAAPNASSEASPPAGEDAQLVTGGAVMPPTSGVDESVSDGKKFDELSCAEMAVQLQKNIADWQKQWGHLASTT